MSELFDVVAESDIIDCIVLLVECGERFALLIDGLKEETGSLLSDNEAE